MSQVFYICIDSFGRHCYPKRMNKCGTALKCHIVLMSRFRVKVLARSWPLPPHPPPISLCTSPSTGCVFGCCTPSLCVNSFPTPLILDAICNSFSGLSYLCATSRACPAPALLSVYHNCTSVEKQIKQHRSAVSAVSTASGCLLLAILPTPPCRVALGSTAQYYAVYTYACEQ